MHIYKKQILEHHLDTFGHVNNATYLEIYEEARWDLIESQGYGISYIKEKHEGPVILEATVKYKKELINRENIKIETTYGGELNPLVMIINQKMIKENNEIASEASFCVGVMNLAKRKLVRPPEYWVNAIKN